MVLNKQRGSIVVQNCSTVRMEDIDLVLLFALVNKATVGKRSCCSRGDSNLYFILKSKPLQEKNNLLETYSQHIQCFIK